MQSYLKICAGALRDRNSGACQETRTGTMDRTFATLGTARRVICASVYIRTFAQRNPCTQSKQHAWYVSRTTNPILFCTAQPLHFTASEGSREGRLGSRVPPSEMAEPRHMHHSFMLFMSLALIYTSTGTTERRLHDEFVKFPTKNSEESPSGFQVPSNSFFPPRIKRSASTHGSFFHHPPSSCALETHHR